MSTEFSPLAQSAPLCSPSWSILTFHTRNVRNRNTGCGKNIIKRSKQSHLNKKNLACGCFQSHSELQGLLKDLRGSARRNQIWRCLMCSSHLSTPYGSQRGLLLWEVSVDMMRSRTQPQLAGKKKKGGETLHPPLSTFHSSHFGCVPFRSNRDDRHVVPHPSTGFYLSMWLLWKSFLGPVIDLD